MESTKMINKKVPGAVPPIGKLEDEANKFKKEIIKKKTCELKDLLNRQNAILQNHKLILVHHYLYLPMNIYSNLELVA